MLYIIGEIIEFMVKYACLVVLVGLIILLFLLVLLPERRRVRNILMVEPVRRGFDWVCEISDRMDEPYAMERPYGHAMWVPGMIFKGVILEVMLLIVWGIVAFIRK